MTRCNVPMHNAVATSAALGFPIALANVAGYIVGGGSVAESVPAPLGAKVAHAMNVAALKKAFAVLLFMLAAYMLFKVVVEGGASTSSTDRPRSCELNTETGQHGSTFAPGVSS